MPHSIAREVHFFEKRGRFFVPSQFTASPWDIEAVHGAPAAALLTYEIERSVTTPGFTIGRITFDLFRPVPMAPLSVRTAIVRDGRRVKGIDAYLEHEGTVVSRATAVAVRQTETPPTPEPDFPHATLPLPESVEPLHYPHDDGRLRFHHFAEVRPFSDVRKIFRDAAWVRMPSLFLPEEPITPLARAAASADFTSAFANAAQGLATPRPPGAIGFINTDITLYLHRYPASEWLAMGIAGRSHTAGISVGHVALYDQEGPVGRCTTLSLAQPTST